MVTTARFDNLIEIIKERRVNGAFKPDPIPFEAVERIVEAGTWAPSGNNAQPWEFIVLRSPEKVKGLTDTLAPPSPPGTPPRTPTYASVEIIVVGDTRLKESYPTDVPRDEVFYSSMAACIQNMQLAATALGLASTWQTIHEDSVEPVTSFLGLPDHYEIVARVRMGYAAESRETRPRRPVSEVMHIDGTDPSKVRSQEDLNGFVENSCKGWGRL